MPKEIKPVNKLKVFIIILLIIFAVFLNISSIFKEETQEIQNLNNISLKSKSINYLFFDKIKITKISNNYIITSKVTNQTSNTLSLTPITVIIKDSSGKNLINSIAYLGDKINPEESKTLYIKTNQALKDARDIEIKVQTSL